MMDDWQEAVFSNRHTHNRVGKGGNGKGAKGGGAFDVTKTFGTYEIDCPMAKKHISGESGESDVQASRLELFRLNEEGNTILGEMIMPQVLHATVLLAGSRRTMNSTVASLDKHLAKLQTDEDSDNTEKSYPQPKQEQEEMEDDVCANEDDESNSCDGHETRHEDGSTKRFRTFEKNSFRSPKFWLRWQGRVIRVREDKADPNTLDTDSGYLVFSGNNCNKFQGTISCEALDWDNVKITGRKIASRSVRDTAVAWYPA